MNPLPTVLAARQLRQAERERWLEHTGRRLRTAGFHNGGARAALLDTLALTGGGLTAPELQAQTRRNGRPVGAASVYRILAELEGIGAIRRVELGQSQALVELVDPAGEHHHHIVCDACGRTQTFADAGLEEAIGRIERDVSFTVHAHDVILHGICPHCHPQPQASDVGPAAGGHMLRQHSDRREQDSFLS